MRVKDGGILLSVHSHSSDWTKRAKLILEATGALDISSSQLACAKSVETRRMKLPSAVADQSDAN